MNDIASVVAANLRRLRAERNMSLSELARRAELAKGSLAKLESGQGNPTIHTVAALADGLNVSPGDLLIESSPELLRADEGPVLKSEAVAGRVISKITGSVVEIYDLIFFADVAYRSEHMTAGAIEQLYLVSGCLEVTVGSTVMTLNPSDAVRYPLDQPITMVARSGNAHAIVVAVLTSQAPNGAQSGFTARPRLLSRAKAAQQPS